MISEALWTPMPKGSRLDADHPSDGVLLPRRSTLGLQVFDDAFADSFPFDVLDATKIIPEEDVPIRIVGRLVLDRVVDNFFAETEQVAFCTQNIVPGIDFTNDPLLQGRNFSYLDTQLKRLGGPNFTHIPVNAPKCPFHHFQQDGHMAMRNPKGRVNYEPNGWSEGGPRADAEAGFRSLAVQETGEKRRIRAETFADHYSQARQFYRSQTPIEQQHIADAIIFELSKVETPPIRTRIVGHLLNIDTTLAQAVADGLGLMQMPDPTEPARTPIDDLAPSPKLSILENGPDSFKGRKLGILVSDGADDAGLEALMTAAEAVGAIVELVAPRVGGIATAKGEHVPAQQKVEGGPSVLYDAVAVMVSKDGAETLATSHAAKTFVADAFAHLKFIAHSDTAQPLLEAAGVTPDAGVMPVAGKPDAQAFIEACAKLRHWDRIPA